MNVLGSKKALRMIGYFGAWSMMKARMMVVMMRSFTFRRVPCMVW